MQEQQMLLRRQTTQSTVGQVHAKNFDADKLGNAIITGGAGFIGSNFLRFLLGKDPEVKISVIDKLTYAGNLENIKDVMDKITFIKADICDRQKMAEACRDADIIFNFAAETHVDRSIAGSEAFVYTDVFGTLSLLEAARQNDAKYIQISTDEVYGSRETPASEEALLNPCNPYSASKAAADMLVNSYFATYGLKTIVTRSSNNFGQYQYPEKLIPLFITNALRDKQLPLYGDGMNVRDWLYVADNCSGIALAAANGKPGEIYNIAAGNEMTNLEITRHILANLKNPETLIRFVEDRRGHDRRYSITAEKMHALGWQPRHRF